MLVNTVIVYKFSSSSVVNIKKKKTTVRGSRYATWIFANAGCGVNTRMKGIGIFKIASTLKEECQANPLSTIKWTESNSPWTKDSSWKGWINKGLLFSEKKL